MATKTENKESLTFVRHISVQLDAIQKAECIKMTNQNFVGRKNVNILDESGKLVADKSLTITEQHKEAHWLINACHQVAVKVTVDKYGKFSFSL